MCIIAGKLAERNSRKQPRTTAKATVLDAAAPTDEQTAFPPVKPVVSGMVPDSTARQSRQLGPGEFWANKATRQQLMQAKGIGRVRADSILDELAAGGDFKNFRDLRARVRGIGPVLSDNLSAAGMVFA